MKLTLKLKTTLFKDVPFGAYFSYAGNIFYKTPGNAILTADGTTFNCINLTLNQVIFLREDTITEDIVPNLIMVNENE